MTELISSKIYVGNICHRRFTPKNHSFNYSIYMLALDVTEIEQQLSSSWIFGYSILNPLKFSEKDYLRSEPGSLNQRIRDKVTELGGDVDIFRIVMLVQVRCFGIYFSPANFYFCYDQNQKCTHMLAEVSNTPWNERHYYLVDLQKIDKRNKKSFQVSPFMDLDMSYFWQVKPPSDDNDRLVINIESKRKNLQNGKWDKLFDASLVMHKKEFTHKSLLRVWCQLPVMTIKIFFSIYWQALKLFIKGIPFIGYQKPR
ncbi:MAG: DUF1365 family protein [Alteromonadaceae bacterium]|jgi:DUF1365 family protein